VEKVIHLRMLVEATLDFPEEEIDFLEASNARGQLTRIREDLAGVLKQARQGSLLREGLSVVLAGQPNVGKSSLLNALAGADLAIVTPIAGTTRDRVRETIQIDGIPLHIIDTAGLRDDAADEVERIGIERTWEAIRRADIVLHLIDAADYIEHGISETDDHIDDRLSGQLPPGLQSFASSTRSTSRHPSARWALAATARTWWRPMGQTRPKSGSPRAPARAST
jgi:tRNA modification GTPase